jgi:hypothetical protein
LSSTPKPIARGARLEPFPFRLNRNGALAPCLDAFSSREPESTSLENALIAGETTKQRSKPIVKQSACEKRDRFDAAVATANHYLEALDFHGIFGRDTIRRSGYRECPK